jgi:hypothetical protein
MGPYSLSSLGSQQGSIQASDTFASWLVQPYQINSGGSLPGTTAIGVNGYGVVISGPDSSIIISSSNSSQDAVISLLGQLGYILFTNPTSKLNQIIIGQLPDGTFGMVISKPGIDVLNVFS